MVFAVNKVQIYGTDWCPYCSAAKELLESKGISYDEIDVSDPGARQSMIERANGRRTVPQIFIGDEHIGGYNELAQLDRRGQLDPLKA